MKSFTGIIFKKELLDIVRDRRTVLMTFLLPLVLYPVMFWFIGSQTAEMLDGPSETVIAAESAAAEDLSALLGDPVFSGAGIRVAITGDPASALREGEADLVLESFTVSGGKTDIELIYDPNKTSSSMSLSHFNDLLNAYNQAAQTAELAKQGIKLADLTPLRVSAASLAALEGEEESGAGMFLSMMLPMLMILLLSVGGMATAVDLFAGEKERRTFEPLLCTGARRTDILAGKLLAVAVMSLLSAIASVSGMVVGYLVNPRAMTMGLDDAQGIALPLPTILFVLLIIAATAVFFSGLHILLSTYARSVKEASTYGAFVMMASYVPIFATMQMLGGDFELWSAFVPIMNVSGCLKMVLAGIEDPLYMLITLGVTLLFVGIVLAAGRYMFKKENIMLRA
ncbi:MAG: ABC transporter permease subunit [Oscillospiraceae bacterium]|jgi:sodium transport system permease protein|nr:ABC transporter permease subunit [Oscillospiraceae bacterium]